MMYSCRNINNKLVTVYTKECIIKFSSFVTQIPCKSNINNINSENFENNRL